MLITQFPFFVGCFIIFMPFIIRWFMCFHRWRVSDKDPQYPKNNFLSASLAYNLHRRLESGALPFHHYPKFWIGQIGWILVWVFPYRWLGL